MLGNQLHSETWPDGRPQAGAKSSWHSLSPILALSIVVRLRSSFIQPCEGEGIRRSREVLVEGSDKGFRVAAIVAVRPREERHAGAKFQIVRRPENLLNRALGDSIDQLRAELQPRPQDGMIGVRPRLLQGPEAKTLSRRAPAQAFDLRENK